jgi:8-oxo-dGTP diphosphatase
MIDDCPGPAVRSGVPLLHAVAAALVDADGRVLVATRPPGKAGAGRWEFPGGKIDAGETPEAALVRELAEELGIDTSASCLAPAGFASHDSGAVHLVLLLFVCRRWRGTPVAREGQALRWCRPAELFALDLLPADRPLAAMLDALL